MFANRRPGKRSIVGTRICAPTGDGLFAPGMIQSVSGGSAAGRHQRYAVQFDTGTVRESFTDRDLIGPGFQALSSVRLIPGQTVYITHNGREVKGSIVEGGHKDREAGVFEEDLAFPPPISSDEANGILCVSIGTNGDTAVVHRKIDDLRLVESRKSARLIDQDTDYIKLSDPPFPENKKRMVSTVIDVPTPQIKHSRCNSETLDCEEDMQYDEFTISRDVETELMDEHTAAMVLTSLSCSPVSPVFPFCLTKGRGESSGSSGVWSGSTASSKSIPSTPSPPKLLLSQSAPADVHMLHARLWQRRNERADALNDSPDEDTMQVAKRTVYRCTWPGCSKMYNTCPGIEKHVRIEHLGPKDDSCIVDEHEEEFYFTEVEVTLDTVMQTFADMYTSTSPSSSAFPYYPGMTVQASHEEVLPRGPSWPPSDHDYQRKEFRSTPLSIPTSKTVHEASRSQQSLQRPSDQQLGLSLPLAAHAYKQPAMSSSLPWQMIKQQAPLSPPLRLLDEDSCSYPSLAGMNGICHKKSRTEVKKCRKVYGLDNRSLWCTQCKWKKACTRFHEKGDLM